MLFPRWSFSTMNGHRCKNTVIVVNFLVKNTVQCPEMTLLGDYSSMAGHRKHRSLALDRYLIQNTIIVHEIPTNEQCWESTSFEVNDRTKYTVVWSEVVLWRESSYYRPVDIVKITILWSNLVCTSLVALSLPIGVWLRRWIRPLINRFRTSSDLMTLVIGGDFNETGLGLVCMLVSSSVSEVWLALVSTGI